MLLSGSRDKTLIVWNLTRDESQYGYPKKSLHGHSHIVSDCVCTDWPLVDRITNGNRVMDEVIWSNQADGSNLDRLSPPTALTPCPLRGTRP